MPGLLELQCTWGAALLAPPAAAAIEGIDPLLLGIYRNTCQSALVNALALSFPAVRRLVGAEFFEAVVHEFLLDYPPRSAYLSDYGEDLPIFLGQHGRAGALPYLADVARLEWAVNRALYAADMPALPVAALSGLDPASILGLRFVPHPGVSLLNLATPADAVWRAVLDEDEAAMRALDPRAGPVWLLIERSEAEGVQVRRMAAAPALLTQHLLAGKPLQAALDAAGATTDAATVLADHLASGRFVGWRFDRGTPIS